jgi:hypothetical protein
MRVGHPRSPNPAMSGQESNGLELPEDPGAQPHPGGDLGVGHGFSPKHHRLDHGLGGPRLQAAARRTRGPLPVPRRAHPLVQDPNHVDRAQAVLVVDRVALDAVETVARSEVAAGVCRHCFRRACPRRTPRGRTVPLRRSPRRLEAQPVFRRAAAAPCPPRGAARR